MNRTGKSHVTSSGPRGPWPVRASSRRQARGGAFTVLEMLVVLAIIGLLAALIVPNLKGMRQSNTMASANRQLLDDFAQARHLAIRTRSTVYVIFVPPAEWINPAVARLSGAQSTNFLFGQFNSYVLFSRRQVGEQPGRENPRFLSALKTLPDGVFVQTNKFDLPNLAERFDTNSFPFPGSANEFGPLPYVAFDFQGKMVRWDQGRLVPDPDGEVIPLARGSIFYARNSGGGLDWVTAETRENPPGNSVANYNHVVIDGLTGRATVIRPEIQ